MNDRLTIADVAESLKVTPRTIMRWEKTEKIKRSKRDWRGWRFYSREDLDEIRKFYEGTYESGRDSKAANGNIFRNKFLMAVILANMCFYGPISMDAATTNFAANRGVKEAPGMVDIVLADLPAVNTPQTAVSESLKYTLGANDVVSIEVRRHPEFEGQYQVNSEGKIGYKYVGDIIVAGLTKNQLKDRLTEVLSAYLVNPEVDVQIVAYLSKVVYVVGDVMNPGKFYMRGDTILVREALVQAGLPTQAASLHKCRLITPDQLGENNFQLVDVHKLLYEGDLKYNMVMKPGDVLYVPATLIASVIRVISPVTNVVSQASGSAVQGAAVAAMAL
ncbi:MAG: polysaccharide biosynthesis/export family protein [Candidatus Omnitrophica bacterium]|nr:polysaccharide biosynthesis/export family protein [Candidatus Omnitrophota bacterium]